MESFDPQDQPAEVEAAPRRAPAMPPRPERPENPPQKQRGCGSILMASLAGLLLLAGLIALTLPFGAVPIAAASLIGGLMLLGFLHYITWGWWLGAWIRREETDADKDSGT